MVKVLANGKELDVIHQYFFGEGNVGISVGYCKATNKEGEFVKNIPSILISEVEGDNSIGEIVDSSMVKGNNIQFFFKNIECLNILQEALDNCKKQLKNNE
jgi:hypothetical protein